MPLTRYDGLEHDDRADAFALACAARAAGGAQWVEPTSDPDNRTLMSQVPDGVFLPDNLRPW